jgi:hypothetical protein
MLRTRRLALCLTALIVGRAEAAAPDPWAASYDPATQTRFIPVELWTGALWDGGRNLHLTPADLVFGKRGEKRITGPIAWTRPGSGEQLQVYERDNRGKKQFFTISSRRDGLGRVHDSRYARDCTDEVKFPLGQWKKGERRTFDILCNDGKMRRTIELTIQEIDYVYMGMPHSLRFHWVIDGGRKPGTDMTYIYSPGRGLVYVNGDE